MKSSWQENWEMFVDALGERFRAGDAQEMICEQRMFGLLQLKWDPTRLPQATA